MQEQMDRYQNLTSLSLEYFRNKFEVWILDEKGFKDEEPNLNEYKPLNLWIITNKIFNPTSFLSFGFDGVLKNFLVNLDFHFEIIIIHLSN